MTEWQENRLEYVPSTSTQRAVDLVLHFHHKRMQAILSDLASNTVESWQIVVEIGSGAKSRRILFPRSNFVTMDFVKREGIDVVASISDLPFRDETVDFVLCENVLEHIPEPERAITQVWSAIRKGGYLYLVTPFLFPLHDLPYDFYRYTEYSLKHLLKIFTETSVNKVLWLPKPKKLFERFVLYYVTIAKK